MLMCVSYSCTAHSQARLSPDDVEAAYLYDFSRFVQWPANARANSQPFSLCLLGQDNLGRKLDDLIAGEAIQGRKMVALRLSSVDVADNCQIVFIGDSEGTRLEKDLDTLKTKPILTVSNLAGFLERGGMIQFLLQGKRVRFAVNLSAAQQAGLALSSELLKVAAYVNTKPPAEDKR
jgi:YfiR/HmsC-like